MVSSSNLSKHRTITKAHDKEESKKAQASMVNATAEPNAREKQACIKHCHKAKMIDKS